MAGTINLAICSLSQSSNDHKKFINHLENELEIQISVSYVCISSEHMDLDHDFSLHDGAVLIHSAESGRVSLTNVRDARYEKLLHRLETMLGKNRVGILITGVPNQDHEELNRHFQTKQPQTKRDAGYVNICETELDESVTKSITKFLSNLSHCDRPPKELERARSSRRTVPLTTERVPIRAEQLRSITVKDNIDLIICAESSTENTLLRTLSEMQETTDFLIFQQDTGDLPENKWNFVEARNIAIRQDSSSLIHFAVFIYRNKVPTEFSNEDITELKKVMRDRTNQISVEVEGEPSSSCLQQLSTFTQECAFHKSIVRVTHANQESTSSLKADEREEEYHEEENRKKEERERKAELKEIQIKIVSMKGTTDRLTNDVERLRKKREKVTNWFDGEMKELKQKKNDIWAKIKISEEEIEHELAELQNKIREKEGKINMLEKQSEQIYQKQVLLDPTSEQKNKKSKWPQLPFYR